MKTIKCSQCSKEFQRKLKSRQYRKLFCTRQCHDLYQSYQPEDFWDRVHKSESCWEWTGYIEPAGYGRMRMGGKAFRTHRLAYLLIHGSIPDGLQVLHKCDNRKCVNPEHLFLGTRAENILDMVSKRRHLIGSKKPNAKLNESAAKTIVSLFESGQARKTQLARMFSVNIKTISEVLERKTWTHATIVS